jgi:hypothetical protein
LAGSYDTPGYSVGVYVSGDCAYVADQTSGLQVINITDPAHPSLAGSYDTPGVAFGVYVSGDCAYVADDTSGLQVINITDPTHPSLAGSYNTPGFAYSVYVSGDCAYVADYGSGLQVIDIANPAHPSLAGSCSPPDYAEYVYVSGDYAYVADDNLGLVVIEVQRNYCSQFASNAIAQSLSVYDEYSLTHATLQATETQSIDTSTAYYLSADGGLHWEPVVLGVRHDFVNSGNQLCWRAVFSTAAWNESPILYDLSISYNFRLDAPEPTSPSDGLRIGDNTPLLQWTDTYVGVSYLVQVDIVTGFDSDYLVNIMVPVGWKNCTAPVLTDGLWYWRVVANDTGGDLGFFSLPWTMIIDTTKPTWDPTPADKVLSYLTPFRYNLNASDPSGISTWWINDTAHFVIDSSGVITNTTPLAVGVYGIEVWVNDTLNNIQTAEFSVWVLTPPTSTTTTSAPMDFGTLALILSVIGWAVVLVTVAVFWKRRPSS